MKLFSHFCASTSPLTVTPVRDHVTIGRKPAKMTEEKLTRKLPAFAPGEAPKLKANSPLML
eukprot:1658428-Amphidinium_carterae.1